MESKKPKASLQEAGMNCFRNDVIEALNELANLPLGPLSDSPFCSRACHLRAMDWSIWGAFVASFLLGRAN